MKDESMIFYDNVCEELKKLEHMQVLIMALLGTERLWQLFFKWSEENSVIETIEMVRKCIEILWNQIWEKQKYNQEVLTYNTLLEKIKVTLDNKGIEDWEEGSWLIQNLSTARSCFFNPDNLPKVKLFPVNKEQFWWDAASMVVGEDQYISNRLYDLYYYDMSEEEFRNFILNNSKRNEELQRVQDDLILVKSYPNNYDALMIRCKEYKDINLFVKE